MNVAIVQAERADALELAEYLNRFGEECGERQQVCFFSDGDEILRGYGTGFDLILMDVEMKLVSGLDAAEQIRRMDAAVQIVFVTASPQYAVRGYAVRALDYLIKPLGYEDFLRTVQRARAEALRSAAFALVEIVNRRETVRLRAGDILWIESSGHRLRFHTAAGDYESTLYTVKQMEDKLAPHGFCRCNSGCLVNLRMVRTVRDDEISLDGARIRVSRGKRADFFKALSAYIIP